MWVYIRSEPGLYTVGFFDPKGQWHTDSDHESKDAAAARVHYLNGGAHPNRQIMRGDERWRGS